METELNFDLCSLDRIGSLNAPVHGAAIPLSWERSSVGCCAGAASMEPYSPQIAWTVTVPGPVPLMLVKPKYLQKQLPALSEQPRQKKKLWIHQAMRTCKHAYPSG